MKPTKELKELAKFLGKPAVACLVRKIISNPAAWDQSTMFSEKTSQILAEHVYELILEPAGW